MASEAALRKRRESLRVLGLDGNASASAVRHTYLALAKQHHPDAGGSKERFQLIRDAYEALKGMPGTRARERTVAEQYSDLMAQRAKEPFIIRWFWRGPSIRVKFRIKAGVMALLFAAALYDEQQRPNRRR